MRLKVWASVSSTELTKPHTAQHFWECLRNLPQRNLLLPIWLGTKSPPPVSKNVEMQKKTTQPPNVAIFGVFKFKKPPRIFGFRSAPRTPVRKQPQCSSSPMRMLILERTRGAHCFTHPPPKKKWNMAHGGNACGGG